VQYPLSGRETLVELARLKENKVFMWLMEQQKAERESSVQFVLTTPTDIAGVIAREQAIGNVNGLSWLEPVIEKHIDTLKRKLD